MYISVVRLNAHSGVKTLSPSYKAIHFLCYQFHECIGFTTW